MADTGFGMSAKDKENLFTLFYRGNRENKKEVEGYGIGMTLAHKIIHLHDGNIAVHSEQGKGTISLSKFRTFKLILDIQHSSIELSPYI